MASAAIGLTLFWVSLAIPGVTVGAPGITVAAHDTTFGAPGQSLGLISEASRAHLLDLLSKIVIFTKT